MNYPIIINRWSILEEPRKSGRYYFATCRCSCGVEKQVNVKNVISGLSKSCGCLNIESIIIRNQSHGDSMRKKRSPLYAIWAGMLSRCKYKSNARQWKHYGGRGISVCDQWKSYLEFKEWAMRSGYSVGLSIERSDVNGNYCPLNCKWIPKKNQAHNRRDTIYVTAFNERKTLLEWEADDRCSVRASLIRNRIDNGWPQEHAVRLPKMNKWSRQKPNFQST